MSVADHPWRSLALRLLAGLGLAAALGATLGWPFALLSLFGLGLLMSEPIIEILADARRRTRAYALRDATGLHFEHGGHAIRVLETDSERWLRAAQIQQALGDTAREEVYARRFQGEAVQFEGEPGWYVRDEALWNYLEQSNVAMDGRRNSLRLFVQRQVIAPHRRRRRAQSGR